MLYAENHLEGETVKKNSAMLSAISFFKNVKVRLKDVTSEPLICLFFVCIVKMPRLEARNYG